MMQESEQVSRYRQDTEHDLEYICKALDAAWGNSEDLENHHELFDLSPRAIERIADALRKEDERDAGAEEVR